MATTSVALDSQVSAENAARGRGTRRDHAPAQPSLLFSRSIANPEDGSLSFTYAYSPDTKEIIPNRHNSGSPKHFELWSRLKIGRHDLAVSDDCVWILRWEADQHAA